MRLLAALLCLLAGPLAATQDAWPALYDVTDVAPDDVLNIRANPRADAEIIGSLAYDATSVEVIRPAPRADWGLVNTGEGTGWVSLRYLARQPGQWLGALPPVANCAGTEPSWSLDVAREQLTYRAPEAEAQGYTLVQSGPARGRRDRFHLRGQSPEGEVTALIALQQCSDGMSSREYGLGVDLLLSGSGFEHLSGCCSLSR